MREAFAGNLLVSNSHQGHEGSNFDFLSANNIEPSVNNRVLAIHYMASNHFGATYQKPIKNRLGRSRTAN